MKRAIVVILAALTLPGLAQAQIVNPDGPVGSFVLTALLLGASGSTDLTDGYDLIPASDDRGLGFSLRGEIPASPRFTIIGAYSYYRAQSDEKSGRVTLGVSRASNFALGLKVILGGS